MKKSDDDSLLQFAKTKWNNENVSAEEIQILYLIDTGSFQHHNNCGSTHPSMAASKENKLSASFSGSESQNFSMNPAVMESQEQTMMNSH